ncbi:MAG TPA: cytochrome D1 domain-containing protein [Gemmatimonadales bacterium]|nr:cytochrome D1 domain-containing protein [Gemmatimonadales bacterium]
MPSLLLAITILAQAQAAVPAGALLIVANKQEATASIIEIGSGQALATVPTGSGPHEVAVAGSGEWAIVANYGGQEPGSSLTVIDLLTHSVRRTIDLGEYRRPHGIVVLPGDSLVVVTVEANSAVLLVNPATGVVERAISTNARGSHMVAVTADGRRAFTANVGSNSITEIDLVGGTPVRSLDVAPRTEGVGVTPDGREVWVGSNTDHTVTVVDAQNWKVLDTLPAAGLPYRVAISADGGTALVPAPMTGVLRVFDVASRSERRAISFGDGQPVGTAISPDGAYAFVSLQGTDEAAMVDLRTLEEVRRFKTGAGPDGIAVAW